MNESQTRIRRRLTVKQRISRMVRALTWVLRNPGRARDHWRWVVQTLGGSRLLQIRGQAGHVEYVGPAFLDAHGVPLTDPMFVPAPTADHMRDDDVVLGLVIGDDARAYPWWIMDDHHFANDTVGNTAVVVMLCEMCSTGVAFEATAGGKRLSFTHGPHFNGTLALMDVETKTLWSPYLGRGIKGKLQGTSLTMLPLRQMTWRAWRDEHPQSVVLSGEYGSRTGHGSDHTIGTAHVTPGFRGTMARWDERLPFATLVVGVVTPGGQRVYPLSSLNAAGDVVNDVLDDTAIVVLGSRREGVYGGLAFSRTLGARTLTFRPRPGGAVDAETGSMWSELGTCIGGELGGAQLRFIPSHVSEWYVWPTHYPSIEIWSPGA